MQKIILGIDEVGRGPYAGPLVIGACILPVDRAANPWIEELNDSKKLSEKKREELYKIIKEQATSATGWVTSAELDEIGMSEALRLATRRAVEKIRAEKVPFTEIIIDGISNFLVGTTLEKYVTTMKKADFLIKEVSAASIVAKVERDNYMKELAKKYPGYGFEKHVGYGTAAHQKAMETLGLTPEHRRSFGPVAKLAAQNAAPTQPSSTAHTAAEASVASTVQLPSVASASRASAPRRPSTKQIGDAGEQKIADFLVSRGHEILGRNVRGRAFEIDIISKLGDKIYFTEVKTRKSSEHGAPAEFVDVKKLEKMKLGASAYMKSKSLNSNFALAVGTVEGDSVNWFELEAV